MEFPQGGTLPYLALKSPNGTVWYVTVSNAGVLTTSTTAITYTDHTMFWSLSGNATDSTGGYSYSTASGSVVSTGSTYLLNQNAQMTCTAPPLSVVHTEAAWIRLNSVNYYMRLLNGWMQRWPDGNFTLDNCEQYGDAIPATTGVWYFIVVRITGSQATLTVNGTQHSFSSGNTNLVGRIRSSSAIHLFRQARLRSETWPHGVVASLTRRLRRFIPTAPATLLTINPRTI